MTTLRIRPWASSSLLNVPRWTAATAASICQAKRSYHPHAAGSRRVPPPIPFVPDVDTFLTVIGRNMKQHSAKFPTWEALFTLSSPQLKELGVEPPRDRRYLLRWLQKFREGRFGVGGDFHYVKDGVAELRVHEIPDATDPIVIRKNVVNVAVLPAPAPAEPVEAAEGEEATATEAAVAKTETLDIPEVDPKFEPTPVLGYKVVGSRTIAGPFALPLKKIAGSRVKVTEGMWEDKRGRKIDGGERRRPEVRFKRRVAERKARRESQL